MRNRYVGLFLLCGAVLGGGCSISSGMPPPDAQTSAPDMAPPAVELPTVADGLHSGARLKVAYFTGDGGQLLYPSGLYDLDLDVLCEPRLASNGKWHCLPIFLDVPTAYFVDAACSLPLYVRAGVVPPFVTLQTSSGAQVFAPAPYQGLATVYVSAGTSCASRSTPGALAGLTIYSLGGLIPIDTFGEVRLARGT